MATCIVLYLAFCTVYEYLYSISTNVIVLWLVEYGISYNIECQFSIFIWICPYVSMRNFYIEPIIIRSIELFCFSFFQCYSKVFSLDSFILSHIYYYQRMKRRKNVEYFECLDFGIYQFSFLNGTLKSFIVRCPNMCRTHYAHAYLNIVKNSLNISNTEYCHVCVYEFHYYVYGHEYEFQILFVNMKFLSFEFRKWMCRWILSPFML